MVETTSSFVQKNKLHELLFDQVSLPSKQLKHTEPADIFKPLKCAAWLFDIKETVSRTDVTKHQIFHKDSFYNFTKKEDH
jgi:hypothetical protein